MRSQVLRVAMVACTAQMAGTQGIPTTIARAEAEGAAFARLDSTAPVQPLFAQPSGGSPDRRCGRTLRAALPNGSWRSGDFIIRAGSSYSLGLEAGKAHKILWVPLHGASMRGAPLMLRAMHVGHPADTLRLTVAGPARENDIAGSLYGYPSTLLLPSAGEWLVVVTARDDWGCFVLDASEAVREPR